MSDSFGDDADLLNASLEDVPSKVPEATAEEPEIQERNQSACRLLAECFESYLFAIYGETEDSIEEELRRIAVAANLNEPTGLDHARGYYAFHASPMALLEERRFYRFLRGKFERELKENVNTDPVEQLLYELRYPFIAQSKASALAILRESYETLEKEILTLEGPMIDGAASRAFRVMERLLKYVISFYGRWLADQYDARDGNPLDLLKSYFPGNKNKQIRNWINRWYEGERVPSYRQSLQVVKKLNELCLDSEYNEKFHKIFLDNDNEIDGVTYFGSKEQLIELENLADLRDDYSHDLSDKEPRKQNFSKTKNQRLEDAKQALNVIWPYANYLSQMVIPPIVIVQDYFISSVRITRLRCLDEEKRIHSYYLEKPIDFYFGEPCFFYARYPKDTFEKENRVIESAILMPVDFRSENAPEER